MRSTYVHFDDYICEVKSHCHLENLDPRRAHALSESAECLDPEASPQEHSAAHPTRFDPQRPPGVKP